MRAVNLIPEDQRRGAGGSGGRSGGIAYAIVGLLVGIVAMVTLYAMTSSKVSTRKSELTSLQQQVADSQTANAQLAKYSALAAQRQARVATVTQLADTRFDWAHAMLEVPRVVSKGVWLESMAGNVSPSSSATSSTTTAATGPQIEIQGCTTGMIPVANVMAAMSRMDGVTNVDLIKASKSDSATATQQSQENASSTGCQLNTNWPLFDIVVTYEEPGGTLRTGTDIPSATPVDNTTPASSLGSTPTVTPTPSTPVSTGAPTGATG